MAAIWLALVAYGSLVPLNFQVAMPRDVGGLVQSLWLWFTSPRWVIDGPDNLSSLGNRVVVTVAIVNLGLYLPAGMFLRLWFWQKGWRTARQIAAAVAMVVAMSWVLECTQGLLPRRYASLNDVIANVLGAAAGAACAVRLRWAIKRLTFRAYGAMAPMLHDVGQWLGRLQHHSGLMFLVAAANVGLLVWWSVTITHWEIGGAVTVNWLPFARHIVRSYDVAAIQIARSLLLYAGIASLLTIPFLVGRQRWAVIIVMALAVVVREAAVGVGSRQVLDVTEPIIAAVAVALMYSTAWLLVHAVSSSCRRRRQEPIPADGDRRRRPHRYRQAAEPGGC